MSHLPVVRVILGRMAANLHKQAMLTLPRLHPNRCMCITITSVNSNYKNFSLYFNRQTVMIIIFASLTLFRLPDPDESTACSCC